MPASCGSTDPSRPGGLHAWKPERKPRDSGGGGRPPWQLRLSLLSMAFAGLVGLVLLAMTSGGLFCSTITRFSGANIAIGAKIALVGGIVGMLASLVASVLAPDSPRVLSWVLLLEAATLSIAIGYVARDSAISKQTQDCGLFRRPLLRSTSTASTHGRKRCDAPSLGATHSQRPPAGQSRCGWSSSSKRRLQEVGRAEEVRAAIALLSEASRPAR